MVRSKNRRSSGVFSGTLEGLDQPSVILLAVGLTSENETIRTRTVGLKPATRWNHLGSLGASDGGSCPPTQIESGLWWEMRMGGMTRKIRGARVGKPYQDPSAGTL